MGPLQRILVVATQLDELRGYLYKAQTLAISLPVNCHFGCDCSLKSCGAILGRSLAGTSKDSMPVCTGVSISQSRCMPMDESRLLCIAATDEEIDVP